MTDPIREALERLVELDPHAPGSLHRLGWKAWSDAVAAARAALASDGPAMPGGKGSAPTRPVTDDDLDLLVIAIQALTHQPDASTHDLAAVDRGREILRNALARWGRPAPPAAGEAGELVAWLRETGELIQPSHLAEHQRYKRAAALLEQLSAQAPQPVPVGDPPKPEDCDAKGRCWFFDPCVSAAKWNTPVLVPSACGVAAFMVHPLAPRPRPAHPHFGFPAMTWQPIDTAPKDGTEILASDYDAIEIVSWKIYGSASNWESRYGDVMFPAWWQPLADHPPLPTTTPAGQEGE